MLEKYTKEEILGFIEAGYRELGDIGSKNAAIALIRGLPGEEVMEVSSVQREVLDKHGIPHDYVPPRALVRRALALMLSFHETIAELEKSAGASVVDSDVFEHEALHLFHNSGSVADIYQLSDERVDMLLRFCGVLNG